MREQGEFMVRVDIEFDERELKKLTDALKHIPKECQNGLISAINKSVKTTNTTMQKAITQRYNIKKSDLSKSVKFNGYNSNNLIQLKLATKTTNEANILVRGSRLALVTARSMVSPKQPKNHKGKTMKQIKRIAPPKVKILKSGQKIFAHAFVATTNRGITALFSRDKVTDKLIMRRTLSVAHMVRQKQIAEATQKAAKEALTKNVAHEIKYRLQKVSK